MLRTISEGRPPREYAGVSRIDNAKLRQGQLIAIAAIEDSHEVFALDSATGLSNLMRYFNDEAMDGMPVPRSIALAVVSMPSLAKAFVDAARDLSKTLGDAVRELDRPPLPGEPGDGRLGSGD